MKRPTAFYVALLLAVTPPLLTLAACNSTTRAIATPTASATATATSDPADLTVHVQPGSVLGTIPSEAFGLNTAAWDEGLLNTDVPGLLKTAGIGLLRFPGGSQADIYHWEAPDPATPNTFDDFMRVVEAMGAQATIGVNYGTGTPQEAADWVRYANKGGPGYSGPVPDYPGASPTGHTFGITYWEIGSELYGNGSYGITWENDDHANKGPVGYGLNAMPYITAMKAVDPSIKVGVALTAPGNWPDGDAGVTPPWNSTVLRETCAGLDFADVHWYPQDPGNESDANLLGSTHNGVSGRTAAIPAMVARLRAEIRQNCPSRASKIQILITEINSVTASPGKQSTSPVNALFLDDAYMTWLEQGIVTVDWWDLHNWPNTAEDANFSDSLYGSTGYGDFGVLSSGELGEPPPDSPLPTYYALRLLTYFAHPGDQMLDATTDSAGIIAHAVRQSNGDLAVMLINTNPVATHHGAVSLGGFAFKPHPAVHVYGAGYATIASTTARGTASTLVQSLPPYSVTVIDFAPATR